MLFRAWGVERVIGFSCSEGVGQGIPDWERPMRQVSEGHVQTAAELQEAGDMEIVRAIGELPPDALMTESGLAKMFGRHRVSIKRAVERGELPPPVRLFGKPTWIVRALREHLAKRQEAAMKEAERLRRTVSLNSA